MTRYRGAAQETATSAGSSRATKVRRAGPFHQQRAQPPLAHRQNHCLSARAAWQGDGGRAGRRSRRTPPRRDGAERDNARSPDLPASLCRFTLRPVPACVFEIRRFSGSRRRAAFSFSGRIGAVEQPALAALKLRVLSGIAHRSKSRRVHQAASPLSRRSSAALGTTIRPPTLIVGKSPRRAAS